MSKPGKQPEAESEVGNRYSLTIERHKDKPLWRLRERSTIKGVITDTYTKWRAFPEFSPELLQAQGRMKSFIFGDLGARIPAVARRA
jgi:hypothetical protein